jgi:hypothetical protein
MFSNTSVAFAWNKKTIARRNKTERRTVVLQNIDKSKTLHIVLEEEVGTQKLYNSLVHHPILLWQSIGEVYIVESSSK